MANVRGISAALCACWAMTAGPAFFRAGASAAPPEPSAVFGDRLGPITSLSFSPDGKLLAASSEDGLLLIWDVAAGEIRTELENEDARYAQVGFFAGAAGLAAVEEYDLGSDDDPSTTHNVTVWRMGKPPERIGFQFSLPLVELAIAADGSHFAFALTDGRVLRSRLRLTPGSFESQSLSPLTAHEGLRRLAFAPAGPWLATLSRGPGESVVQLWDTESGQVARSLRSPGDSLAWSRDGTWLAVGASIWNIPAGKRERTLPAVYRPRLACVSAHGKFVFLADSARRLSAWDRANGELLAAWAAHGESIGALALSPDGALLATGGDEGTVKLWDTASLLADRPVDEVYRFARDAQRREVLRQAWRLGDAWSDALITRARFAEQGIGLEKKLTDSLRDEADQAALAVGVTLPAYPESTTLQAALEALLRSGEPISQAARRDHGPLAEAMFGVAMLLNFLYQTYDPANAQLADGLREQLETYQEDAGVPAALWAELSAALAEKRRDYQVRPLVRAARRDLELSLSPADNALPLGGSYWKRGRLEIIEFVRGGLVQFGTQKLSSDDTWSQNGSQVTIRSGDRRIYHLTVAGDRLSGTWHDPAEPKKVRRVVFARIR